MVGTFICYSAISFKASDFEMLPLAAHTIMLRVFYFFCTSGDSFSRVVQSFIPAVLYGDERTTENSIDTVTHANNSNKSNKDGTSIETNNGEKSQAPKSQTNNNNNNKIRTKLLLKKIKLLAFLMAILNTTISKLILQKCYSLFTNDTIVQSILRNPWNTLYVTGSVLLHPFLMAFEGSILANRDLGYLVGSYGLTMGVLLITLRFGTRVFEDVWRILLLFQVVRCVLFGWWVWGKTMVVLDDEGVGCGPNGRSRNSD